MTEQLPQLIPEILAARGRRRGRPMHGGDLVLERPRLIAYRQEETGHRQALYLTVENPDKHRERGFILAARTGFGGEMTIAAIVKHSQGWPWHWVDAAAMRQAS